MNLKKYADNKRCKDELKIRFDFIKEMENAVEEQYDAINNVCSHDLILKLKSHKRSMKGYLDYNYTCLCCGAEFNKYNLGFPDEVLKKQPENIIDATEIISEENIDVEAWTQYELDIQGHVNVFVLRAQEKLLELANAKDSIHYSDLAIKQIILEDLKEYDKGLKGVPKTK